MWWHNIVVNLIRNWTSDNMETVGTVLDEVLCILAGRELESFDPVEHVFHGYCDVKYITDF